MSDIFTTSEVSDAMSVEMTDALSVDRKARNLVGEDWIASDSKRDMDLRVTRLLLPFANAAIKVASTAIRREDGEPVYFSQARVGQDGREFELRKLRTMPGEGFNDVGGGHSDPRATRVGRVIRPLGIDELPQLYSVLDGDMSLVSYRPILSAARREILDFLPDFEAGEWDRITTVFKPGLTSLFSLLSRGLPPQTAMYHYSRYKWDMFYNHNADAKLDRQIILKSMGVAMGLGKLARIGSRSQVNQRLPEEPVR